MDKLSMVFDDRILVLDWDGVIDLTADDKYAASLSKIDYLLGKTSLDVISILRC